MDIQVVRQQSTEHGTPGHLDTGDGFECDTLELPWENNKSGISCIIPDTYAAKIWFSPHLNRNVIRLEDKHERQDCLLHNANFAGEASGDITQVHGCTAVGRGYGDILKPDNSGTQWGIKISGYTIDALVEHIIETVGKEAAFEYGAFTVSYSWADGCEPADTTDMNGQA
jgi:hypothetical protein